MGNAKEVNAISVLIKNILKLISVLIRSKSGILLSHNEYVLMGELKGVCSFCLSIISQFLSSFQ